MRLKVVYNMFIKHLILCFILLLLSSSTTIYLTIAGENGYCRTKNNPDKSISIGVLPLKEVLSFTVNGVEMVEQVSYHKIIIDSISKNTNIYFIVDEKEQINYNTVTFYN